MGTITVSHLGKAFKQYPSRWARLLEWVLPGQAKRHVLKWALQDICFTVLPGEAVGIIGLNGAGKSTLLKLITGTLMPTTGHVHVAGRVSALLELGIGFHPDFTGRQNAVMAGQLLGYDAAQLHRLMPEIEAFAEIAGYLDQPVRVYSSGMQMRLAFGVATAMRPDVLIVDEALSVGDAYFQHKSFQRIREFQKLGTTLLLVSHDKQAIQSICDRALLLGSGRVLLEGAPVAVMDYYNAMLADHQSQQLSQTTQANGQVRTASGTGEATIEDVVMVDSNGQRVETVFVGMPVQIRVTVRVNQDLDSLVLGYGIKDRLGQLMYGTNTYHTDQVLTNLKSGQTYLFSIGFAVRLGVGSYSVHASLVRNSSHIEKNYHWIDGAIVFEVINKDKTQFLGCSWNEVVFDVDQIAG
jgi:lipopolysaccharide transport system ATP-binding protein